MDRRIDNKTLLKRALRLRCPVCGQGAMFRSHFKINTTCSACHVTFWRDPGEVLGAMYFDWAAAMFTFLALWTVLAWLTNLSDLALFFILSIAAGATVIICYPWSRSLWTILVYLSGGIERPPLRVLPGGGQRQTPSPQSEPELKHELKDRTRQTTRLHRR